jgi:lactoylglutathione lyase
MFGVRGIARCCPAKGLSPLQRWPYTLPMRIEGVDHIGIRVSDERRAVEFYERFGFEVVYRDRTDPVVILRNDAGVELNFIVNAPVPFDGVNRLMDVPEKVPGYTHIALRVASIEAAAEAVRGWGVTITEGPKQLGPGVSLFIRDPDANVIELRQSLG